MKKVISILFIAFMALSFGQDNQPEDPLRSFARVNLGLHGLEFTYELPISKSIVWENSLGLGMGSNAINNEATYTFALDVPVPHFTSELKYMYNREKRINKGRSTMNNSGNYLGLQSKYSFGNRNYFALNSTLLTEIHWGIQRPLGNRFIFDMHLGLGFIHDFNFSTSSISPTFGLRFGYIMF